MENQGPPDFPSLNPKKPQTKGQRPARRDSPTKPGAPPGTSPSMEHPGNPITEEMALRYAGALQAGTACADTLSPPISAYLPPPSLEGIDPVSISVTQVIVGMKVVIPGSPCLKLGDTFNLLWGSRVFPPQTVDEENINQPVIGTEWAIHTPIAHLPQGNVEVCYDVYRDGLWIGTSAILHAIVPNCYTTSKKQRNRSRSIRRKHPRRPPF